MNEPWGVAGWKTGDSRRVQTQARPVTRVPKDGEWTAAECGAACVCMWRSVNIYAVCPPIIMQKKVRSMVATLGKSKQCRRGGPESRQGPPSQCEGEGWRASAIDIERAVKPAESRRRPVAAVRRSMCPEQPQWGPGRSWTGAECDTPWLGTEQLVARPAWR